MNYLDFYLLSDALVAEKFEGSPSRGNFTGEDWFLIRNAQKVVLLKSFDKFANRMFATRNFHHPMEFIKEKVNQILTGTETKDSLRYYLHSSHDTQVVNAVAWLNP